MKTVKHFSDSGDDRKVLAILENALENYPQQEAQTWFMFYKAFALLKLKGLEAARDLAMDVLDPDNPIEDSAKAMLRGRVLDRMSEANDVEGLARLLPDPLSRDIHALHRQALRIQRDHGLVPDSEPITLGETPPSQLVLSERKNISYRIPAKTHYSTQIKSFLDGKRSYTPAVKTYTLTNCTRISWSCYHFFFDAAGGLIRECSDLLPVLPNGKLPVSLNDNLKDLLKETPPAIPGVSAYICDIFAGPNYCHWILDWLPRLSLCERAAPFDNIFCQRVECDFMRQSLAFLGYQDKTIIAGGDSACVRRFETLLVPDNTTQGNLDHPMQLCHPDLLQWWRSRLSARKPHRKLYIPRVNYRVVLNETDLINLLDGFEIFDPGRYSFAKQIEMFSEAKKVVGAHGAGLTNLLFAPEGCRVLELFPHRGGTGAYISLATVLNHDYDLVMAEGLPPRPGEQEANELSFTVPLEQVAQWLQGNA